MGVKYKDISKDELPCLKDTLNYCHLTGIFTYKKTGTGRKGIDKKAGSRNSISGRCRIKYKNTNYLLHRLAWFYYYGEMPNSFIDHIDGNPSNNAISNLRLATHAENMQNLNKANSHNKLGILGVSMKKYKDKIYYYSFIRQNNKLFNLGSFLTAENAQKAYLNKKREIHPFFVKIA